MKNRTLGTIALLGAPCLFLSFQFPATATDAIGNSPVSNAFGLLYLVGWMCSIYALYRMEAAGKSLFGKALLPLLLFTLTIASISNVYAIIFPGNNSDLYFYLDLCWPLSNLLMFVTGITVALVNKLEGWKRFVPLLVGTWFPIMLTCMALVGRTPVTGTLLGLYSAFTWSLLAVMVMETKYKSKAAIKEFELIYTADKEAVLQNS